MSNKFKYLLFDLDGTIIDPKEGITNSIQYALQKLGCDKIPPSEELLWCIGPPLSNSFPKLLGKDDKDLTQKGIDFYRETFSVSGIYQCFLYEGIYDVLLNLAKSFTLFIATSKPRIYALQILERFKVINFFSEVYGAELNGKFSKKTELIEYLLEFEKISCFDCLMIGDREQDIIGAKGNNMKSCGVLWGYGEKKEFIRYGAEYIVQKPRDLLLFTL